MSTRFFWYSMGFAFAIFIVAIIAFGFGVLTETGTKTLFNLARAITIFLAIVSVSRFFNYKPTKDGKID